MKMNSDYTKGYEFNKRLIKGLNVLYIVCSLSRPSPSLSQGWRYDCGLCPLLSRDY